MNTYAAEMYFGANYSRITYSEDGIPDDFNPSGLLFKIGSNINQNFAIEGRFGFGTADDSNTYGNIDVSVEIDSIYGLYGKGIVPVSDKACVYGIAGYTSGTMTAKASTSVASASNSESDSDLSFGIGFEFDVSNTVGLVLEYIKYMSKSDFDASAIEFGFNMTF